MFCSRNIAFPPRANLLGEVILIRALASYYFWFLVPLGVMSFVTGVYSLVLYSTVQHGCVRGLAYGSRVGGVNSRFMLIT